MSIFLACEHLPCEHVVHESHWCASCHWQGVGLCGSWAMAEIGISSIFTVYACWPVLSILSLQKYMVEWWLWYTCNVGIHTIPTKAPWLILGAFFMQISAWFCSVARCRRIQPFVSLRFYLPHPFVWCSALCWQCMWTTAASHFMVMDEWPAMVNSDTQVLVCTFS